MAINNMLFVMVSFVAFMVLDGARASKNELLDEHERYVRERREGVRIALYHGGYGSGNFTTQAYDDNTTKGEEAFVRYLRRVVEFVRKKHVDKVFLSLQDPFSAAPMLRSHQVIATEFMNALPPWVELGALVELNPKYAWTATGESTTYGGLGPFSERRCEEETRREERRRTTSCVLSVKDASAFCASDSSVSNAWSERGCEGDPCDKAQPGSYCMACGVCHGFDAFADVIESECGTGPSPTPSPPSPGPVTSPCQCPAFDTIDEELMRHYPWCPANVEYAVEWLASLNRVALETNATSRLFTSLAWDKEGQGLYGSSGLYVKAFRLMNERVLSTLPLGYRTWQNANKSDDLDDDRASLIRVGDAGEGSHNARDNVRSVDCTSLRLKGLLDDANVSACEASKIEMLPYVEAYPEMYWYENDLKQQGCIGCPHGTAKLWSTPHSGVSVAHISQCSSCNSPACEPYFSYFSPESVGDFVDPQTNTTRTMPIYDACVDNLSPPSSLRGRDKSEESCPLTCCACLGCIPCAFDRFGNQPNDAIVYQALRNDAKNMADFFIDAWRASGVLSLIQDMPSNTWSMFSLETAHDWNNLTSSNGSTYDVSGAGGDLSHSCLARQYGADTCGTFDGFGTWSFVDFEQMLIEIRRETSLTHFAIYEVQWLPNHWLEA